MYLSANDLKECRPLRCSQRYLQHREVVLCSSLPPGRYIIIPSTFKPNEKGEFLLRVLTEHGSVAIPASKPAPQDVSVRAELSYPHQTALPSPDSVRLMFKKHCDQKGFCKPVHLHNLLTEAIQAGVLAGSEKYLALEHCKSLVTLMGNQGAAKLNWSDFQFLWDKITGWTDIFLVADKNKTRRLEFAEIASALKAAGITVDDLVLQLVVLRYTEPNLTITYPGFLYLVMKLESMTQRFQELDMVGKGFITVSYKQWLQATMYN
uniref:calpain-1 catalytic subunit-like n=1 Tax=Monopterus albus TaxID=43700 RepID=UPI0009B34ED4|nr:calpain-1 catalytic subunit-like [Monopterus albus]